MMRLIGILNLALTLTASAAGPPLNQFCEPFRGDSEVVWATDLKAHRGQYVARREGG